FRAGVERPGSRTSEMMDRDETDRRVGLIADTSMRSRRVDGVGDPFLYPLAEGRETHVLRSTVRWLTVPGPPPQPLGLTPRRAPRLRGQGTAGNDADRR